MKHDPYESWDSNTYRTGSTTPPKAHSRLVAILLVMVILLAGMVSILSVLNIRLFSAFYAEEKQEEISLSLEVGDEPEQDLLPTETVAVSGNKSIGIMGELITPVYQKHFHLPQGLFITHVAEGSTADQQGIQEGDVLVLLSDVAMNQNDSLKNFLESAQPDQECTALIYRQDTDEYLRFTLTVEEIEN